MDDGESVIGAVVTTDFEGQLLFCFENGKMTNENEPCSSKSKLVFKPNCREHDNTSDRFKQGVIYHAEFQKFNGKRNRYYWKCECTCGGKCIVRTDGLTKGGVRSCGCLHKETAIENHKQSQTKIYHTWQGMKARCLNPNNDSCFHYGGRGIKICAEWVNDFAAFFNHVSTLEHFNEGEQMTLTDAAEKSGLTASCLFGRVERNTPDKDIFMKDNANTKHYAEVNGRKYTFKETAETEGVSKGAIYQRQRRGVSLIKHKTIPC